ncbi:MAG: phage portal protein [Oscillospiraceae bacterium]|nr:phage portal protein [Oscillospiraceae bacterium]
MQDYLAREAVAWLVSPERAAQLAAARYLAGKHDILARERRVIGRGGQLETSRNLPNNRLVDNQYAKLVRQKGNYLLGNPFKFSQKSEALERFFTLRRRKIIRAVCEDALSAGIGWCMPYFDGAGRLQLKRIPPYELLPFWADSEHTVLDCALRVYESESCSIGTPGSLPMPAGRAWSAATVKRAELYTARGIERYVLEGGKLLPDDWAESGPWLAVNGKPWFWGDRREARENSPRLPLVAFKAPGEQPLLGRVKSLQDALNTLISDFQNSLQEDARNTILILKNYDGGDLAEFRHNLAAYGAVRVKTVDGTQGGVETLRVHLDHQSYEAMAAMLKRALIENGMGFDINDGALRGTPNRMTLMAMYADIELDADGYEAEWKASFEELLSFIDPASAGKVEAVFERYTLDTLERG